MSNIQPNDPVVVQQLTNTLASLIDELNHYTAQWQERVDSVVVQMQNAATSEPVTGGVTGQVPPNMIPPAPAPEETPQPVDEQPVDMTIPPSTEPTGSSTSDLPEDTTGTSGVTHDFIDPSGDDTITDPSGDDHTL